MIAASGVLALMVYGYQQTRQTIPVSDPPSSADILTDNVVAENQPESVEVRAQPAQSVASQVYSSTHIPSERAFNEYLVSHGEYAYLVSPQPLMSAARIVSYNTGN